MRPAGRPAEREGEHKFSAIVAKAFPFDVGSHLIAGGAKNVGTNFSGQSGEDLCKALRRFSPQCALDALRLWVNGVPTSRRMHDESGVLPCLFCGKERSDDISHYTVCKTLGRALRKVMEPAPP